MRIVGNISSAVFFLGGLDGQEYREYLFEAVGWCCLLPRRHLVMFKPFRPRHVAHLRSEYPQRDYVESDVWGLLVGRKSSGLKETRLQNQFSSLKGVSVVSVFVGHH